METCIPVHFKAHINNIWIQKVNSKKNISPLPPSPPVKINPSFLKSNHFIASLTQLEQSQWWKVYMAFLLFCLVPVLPRHVFVLSYILSSTAWDIKTTSALHWGKGLTFLYLKVSYIWCSKPGDPHKNNTLLTSLTNTDSSSLLGEQQNLNSLTE